MFVEEITDYRWQDLGESALRNDPEEPIKKNDHMMDCLRYLINFIDISHEPNKQPDPYWLQKKDSSNTSGWKIQ